MEIGHLSPGIASTFAVRLNTPAPAVSTQMWPSMRAGLYQWSGWDELGTATRTVLDCAGWNRKRRSTCERSPRSGPGDIRGRDHNPPIQTSGVNGEVCGRDLLARRVSPKGNPPNRDATPGAPRIPLATV